MSCKHQTTLIHGDYLTKQLNLFSVVRSLVFCIPQYFTHTHSLLVSLLNRLGFFFLNVIGKTLLNDKMICREYNRKKK